MHVLHELAGWVTAAQQATGDDGSAVRGGSPLSRARTQCWCSTRVQGVCVKLQVAPPTPAPPCKLCNTTSQHHSCMACNIPDRPWHRPHPTTSTRPPWNAWRAASAWMGSLHNMALGCGPAVCWRRGRRHGTSGRCRRRDAAGLQRVHSLRRRPGGNNASGARGAGMSSRALLLLATTISTLLLSGW